MAAWRDGRDGIRGAAARRLARRAEDLSAGKPHRRERSDGRKIKTSSVLFIPGRKSLHVWGFGHTCIPSWPGCSSPHVLSFHRDTHLLQTARSLHTPEASVPTATLARKECVLWLRSGRVEFSSSSSRLPQWPSWLPVPSARRPNQLRQNLRWK